MTSVCAGVSPDVVAVGTSETAITITSAEIITIYQPVPHRSGNVMRCPLVSNSQVIRDGARVILAHARERRGRDAMVQVCRACRLSSG